MSPKTENDNTSPQAPVTILEAFKRGESDPSSEVINYPHLDEFAEVAKFESQADYEDFLESEPDTLEEEAKARQLAVDYFVLTAERMQRHSPNLRSPHFLPEMADHFTKASIELYGQPDSVKAAHLANRKLNNFLSYEDNSDVDQTRLQRLTDFYWGQIGEPDPSINDEMDPTTLELLGEVRDYMLNRYAKAFEVFDSIKDRQEKIPPEEVRDLFQAGLDVLAEEDPTWLEWQVKIHPTNNAMEEDRHNKTMWVGKNGNDPERLVPLFGHEVLVHCMRSVNGSKKDQGLMRLGLPDFLDSEEGLGAFVEMALKNTKVAKESNLYLYTALALGQLGQPALSRLELQKVYLDELIVAKQAAGKSVDEEALSDQAWRLMNRIYRGSPGNQIIGVNTKDISYYDGYIQTVDYIKNQRSKGVSLDKIMNYISAAPFDPTKILHRAYVAKYGIVEPAS